MSCGCEKRRRPGSDRRTFNLRTIIHRRSGERDGGRCGLTDASVALTRFKPISTVCASSTLYGSSEIFSVAHSQNEAISEALVVDNFESTKPASMIGIKAAAARRRFISGVGGGTGVIFAIGTFYQ